MTHLTNQNKPHNCNLCKSPVQLKNVSGVCSQIAFAKQKTKNLAVEVFVPLGVDLGEDAEAVHVSLGLAAPLDSPGGGAGYAREPFFFIVSQK